MKRKPKKAWKRSLWKERRKKRPKRPRRQKRLKDLKRLRKPRNLNSKRRSWRRESTPCHSVKLGVLQDRNGLLEPSGSYGVLLRDI